MEKPRTLQNTPNWYGQLVNLDGLSDQPGICFRKIKLDGKVQYLVMGVASMYSLCPKALRQGLKQFKEKHGKNVNVWKN